MPPVANVEGISLEVSKNKSDLMNVRVWCNCKLSLVLVQCAKVLSFNCETLGGQDSS